MMAMKKCLLVLLVLCELYEIADGFIMPIMTKNSLTRINMQHTQHMLHDENEPILKNINSYYNANKILSNESSDILRVYTTYNHKYSIIIYKCGKIEQHFNQTLKLKCNQDIIQLNIVSMNYFRKIYEDLCTGIRLRTDISKNEGN
jgi:hypothetical protein